MKQIQFVDYIYDINGKVTEAVVIFTDGTKKVAKTPHELTEVQIAVSSQQRQILIEKTPAGKPI